VNRYEQYLIKAMRSKILTPLKRNDVEAATRIIRRKDYHANKKERITTGNSEDKTNSKNR
jgi:hypothetical protein